MSPEFRANPYPLYAALRRDAPVVQVDPGGLWAVSRYEDVMHILKTPKVYTVAGLRLAADPPWIGRNPFADSMLFVDDPKYHGRLRGAVSRPFLPASLSRLEPALRATAEACTQRVLERRRADFIEDFALPLPASALGTLLGLDPSLNPRLKEWSDGIVAISASQPGDTEQIAQCKRIVAEMEQYLGELIARRRAAPTEDLVSELLQARGEESLTDPEIMGFLFVLLVAGLETTLHLVGHSVRILAEQPGLLARLRADLSLIPAFLEEVLRFEPPVQATMRLCTQEVTLAGVTVPQGSVVMALMASALRDERYTPDAEHFRLERKGPHNLGFGHGMHFCLGAPLARLEARVALESLLPRCAALTPGPEPLAWNVSMTVRGVRSLPLEIHPA
ncbi:cytochrome P450 [Archangium primigenium]|uniref:cytochrome P450 n=1 Tax=[Archangium] primigenium TaxID=2792470 RepID=UPI001EF99CB3|nr:cytochrome P450 [Archangium primigenium]